jgi:hypothetical protein
MSEWWSSIGSFERLFWVIAFPSTAVFILQIIMTLMGLGDHGEIISDIQESMDDMPGDSLDLDNGDGEFLDFKYKFKLFTMRSVVVFFTIFAWTGIVATTSGVSNIVTILIAFIFGVVMMYIVSYIYYFLTKFVEDGTMNTKNAINKEGLVYLTIPSGRKASGKVEVVVQGALRLLDAVTDGDDIPTGSKVVVISISEDQLLLVEKID